MERRLECDGSESVEVCHDLTGAERPVLALVATGQSDERIADTLGQTLPSIRGTLRRFRERTGLAGRMLVAWAVRHKQCCISRTG
ncbi:MAG: helix-turn-helix transcriptional regulator [Dehalococcoidia bacterium]|nr:helix-turn-helix transcriptional regulator [Dehalococcoidia bacterium]